MDHHEPVRGEKRINDELRDRLLDVFGAVAREATVRAAVLTGTGDAFSPGADLWGGPRDPDAAHPSAARRLMKQNSQRLIRTVLEVEQPVIAAVNGVAAGLGAYLALACDLVVMAREARRSELETAARAMAERLAEGATFALGISKRLLTRAYESTLETCLEEESLAQSLVARSQDMREGVQAFAERRKPVFRGR